MQFSMNLGHWTKIERIVVNIDVLLTAHLVIVLATDQLNTQILVL